MVFGADKKLVPATDANNQELQASGNFKGINSYGNMMTNAAPGSNQQLSSEGGQ